MIARICDFCGARMGSRTDMLFEYRGAKFRFAVLRVGIRNGVRWSEADCCPKCLRGHARRALRYDDTQEKPRGGR